MQYAFQGSNERWEVYLDGSALGWTPWPIYNIRFARVRGIGLSPNGLVGGLLAVL
jgi:hypothetical protein